MIQELRYGLDRAAVNLACRVTRSDSPQGFVYFLGDVITRYDTMEINQLRYFFPSFDDGADEGAQLGEWVASEEIARTQAIKLIVAALDEFNGWPQYRDHAYIPGETYDGDEVPTPGGQDPSKHEARALVPAAREPDNESPATKLPDADDVVPVSTSINHGETKPLNQKKVPPVPKQNLNIPESGVE